MDRCHKHDRDCRQCILWAGHKDIECLFVGDVSLTAAFHFKHTILEIAQQRDDARESLRMIKDTLMAIEERLQKDPA